LKTKKNHFLNAAKNACFERRLTAI